MKKIVVAATWYFLFALLTTPLVMLSPWFALVWAALWVAYLSYVVHLIRAHWR